MIRANVLAPQRRPTENDCRNAFATALAYVQGDDTDQNAADALGWSIGTVRNVRNRTNTLSAKLASDAAWSTSGSFLAPWLARLGLRAVPMDSTCDSDAGTHSKLARLAVKIAVALETGEIDCREAADMLPEVEEFQAHLDRIRRLAVQA